MTDTPLDPETRASLLEEQLTRERTSRATADYTRHLITRGTDPDDAARLAATLPERIREFTPHGEPVLALASGKVVHGAEGLRALAIEARLAADRRAAEDPTNAQTSRILAAKQRSGLYGSM